MTNIDVELQHVTKEFPSGSGSDHIKAVDDMSLQIYDGEFFALLGPSGCGKTTTLRMIAGFEEVTAGDILIQGRSVRKTPSYRRPVNTVFQDYALFPHMTVIQNVMFGLKMENVRRKEAMRMAHEALALVQLEGVSDRKPRQLSGGQQQRVALARALVKKPTVLLLDEPLGALDLKLRKAMQFELKAMQQQLGITFIYVTHDQEEALTMADRIAVMHDGKVQQVGNPSEIYEDPSTRYVADFIGETNFIEGIFVGTRDKMGLVQIGTANTIEAVIGDHQPNHNDPVTVAIRPEKIDIFAIEGSVRPSESQEIPVNEFMAYLRGQNTITLLHGKVETAFYFGTDIRYHVQIENDIELVCRRQNFGKRAYNVFEVGQEVNVFWDSENSRILTE